MELFKLFGSVLIEDKSAIEALKGVDKKGKNTGKSLGELADKGLKIGAAIIAGTGAAIGGLLALANSTASTADKWDKLALRTEIGVENLQRWGYAANQSGADIQKLEVGMKTLSVSMVSAQSGSKSSREAYEKLGISMKELSNLTPEQAFERTMFALANMEDGVAKNVVGNSLLGKSYVELKPLIAEGADGMQALKDRADELGLVMSNDSVKAGVVFGDTMDDVKSSFEALNNNLAVQLLPKLNDFLNWIIDHMPEIKKITGDVFEKVGTSIVFIADHSNILIPILGGLFGAFAVLKVISIISGLMAAYTAFTTASTGATLTFSAALMANPIGLVILAITALIAIGIALYMNWDKLTAAAYRLWINITSTFDNIKNSVYEKAEAIKTSLKATFDKVTEIMTAPFTKAKSAIGGIIDAIRNFLNFKWAFPKLSMPHFKVTGSANPLDWFKQGVPKLDISWYAKGAIFDKPTLFNTPYGLKGVGEAGPEVVAPISELKNMLGLSTDRKLEVNLNIANFNNHDDIDIENLADELAFLIKRKLDGGGGFVLN